jgi:hypothetical protein
VVIYYYLLFIFIIISYSVNIKPPRHCFGFSLACDWQNISLSGTNLKFIVRDGTYPAEEAD